MSNKKITLAYPTYRRPKRVEAIEEYYSDLLSDKMCVLFSNNDSSIRFEDNSMRQASAFTYKDNPVPGKIGDNIINCIKGADSEYVLILSDEDFVFGLSELEYWLEKERPDFFVLPALKNGTYYRKPTMSSAFDVLKNKTGNLSGVGFKISAIKDSDIEFLSSLENMDYIHISLMALIADRNGTWGMPLNTFVYMSERYHEGKTAFFQARSGWFSFAGRLSQRSVFLEVSQRVGSDEISVGLKDLLGPSSFYVCFKYGILDTFAQAWKNKMFRFMVKSYLIGSFKRIRSFFI